MDFPQFVSTGANKSAGKSLTFDGAFTGSSQEELYETCGVKRLLQAALQGYNATVFAYRQTGGD